MSTASEIRTPTLGQSVSPLVRVSLVVALSSFLVVWTILTLTIGYTWLALIAALRAPIRGAPKVRRLLDSRRHPEPTKGVRLSQHIG